MSKKVNKIENPMEGLDENEITNIDPTKIGGLDRDISAEFNEEELDWSKSRGKGKDKEKK